MFLGTWETCRATSHHITSRIQHLDELCAIDAEQTSRKYIVGAAQLVHGHVHANARQSAE